MRFGGPHSRRLLAEPGRLCPGLRAHAGRPPSAACAAPWRAAACLKRGSSDPALEGAAPSAQVGQVIRMPEQAPEGGEPRGEKRTRRDVIAGAARAGGAVVSVGLLASLAKGSRRPPTVWQIDPSKCIQCGKCATECVITPSAVKCVHVYALCGYCKLCFGLFLDKRTGNTITAENNRCPVDAIKRRFVEDPFYEMYIDEPTCIGCGICVKGCNRFGNGSLHLQIRHDRCVNCNQCAIARVCPSNAFVRVPASRPYLLRSARRT